MHEISWDISMIPWGKAQLNYRSLAKFQHRISSSGLRPRCPIYSRIWKQAENLLLSATLFVVADFGFCTPIWLVGAAFQGPTSNPETRFKVMDFSFSGSSKNWGHLNWKLAPQLILGTDFKSYCTYPMFGPHFWNALYIYPIRSKRIRWKSGHGRWWCHKPAYDVLTHPTANTSPSAGLKASCQLEWYLRCFYIHNIHPCGLCMMSLPIRWLTAVHRVVRKPIAN